MRRHPTCVIADDEPNLLERLKDLLAAAWPALEVVAEAEDGLAALKALQELRPDIAFLDIRMPGMTGLDLAKVVADRVHIVFVTAYDEYAIAAFESGVVDYVLKPIDPVRLVRVVERLQARLGSPPAEVVAALQSIVSPQQQAPRLQWIQASVGKQLRFISLDEVLYFQSDAKYTRVETADGEALIRTPIKDLATQLDPEHFWQTHRGAIVNIRHIHGVVRHSDGSMEVTVKGRPERLPVSQPFHFRFRRM